MKKFTLLFFLFLSLNSLSAQSGYEVTDESYKDTSVEMADTMRSNGKIYVVVGVIMIIFVGLIGYTVFIDKRISKIEKEVFSEKVNS